MNEGIELGLLLKRIHVRRPGCFFLVLDACVHGGRSAEGGPGDAVFLGDARVLISTISKPGRGRTDMDVMAPVVRTAPDGVRQLVMLNWTKSNSPESGIFTLIVLIVQAA